jgi:hypothetical protein
LSKIKFKKYEIEEWVAIKFPRPQKDSNLLAYGANKKKIYKHHSLAHSLMNVVVVFSSVFVEKAKLFKLGRKCEFMCRGGGGILWKFLRLRE